MKRLSFCFLFLVLGRMVSGQTPDPGIATFLTAKPQLNNKAAYEYLQTLFPEWDLKKMRHICLLVGAGTKDLPPGSRFQYSYQQYIYEAARVDTTKDNDAVTAQKISAM